tara:strand:+ start:435 stop:944 length:510 start_codon:yes stop_codon:yes gene_type:complete
MTIKNALLLSLLFSSVSACVAGLDIRPPTLQANAGLSLGNSTRKAKPADNFSEVRLQDFTVSTPDGSVEICVWDDQCQDGDVVRVSVAGVSYEVKLLNKKHCSQFALGPGTHAIELYAVNGTGFEGSCSFSDANTGAITVGPVAQPGQRQGWSHQGGTGSSARIHVVVQ